MVGRQSGACITKKDCSVSKLDSRSLERIEISQLKPDKRNARTHSKRQIEQIAASIKRFDFTAPILIDEDNRIIAGHGRVAAAKLLEHSDVPCLRLPHLSASEKRAYALADNKVALNASWDIEILASEFQELMKGDFEMELTGFSLPEIDNVLTEVDLASTSAAQPADDHPEPSTLAVSYQGDHWILGRHALVCGDAKDQQAVDTLMAGQQADMGFLDVPYNVPIHRHVSGLGRIRHREFAEASGEMSKEAFTEFLRLSLSRAAAVCKDGAIVFV
jgi:ParB-like chromosome segregation protein Spo0J